MYDTINNTPSQSLQVPTTQPPAAAIPTASSTTTPRHESRNDITPCIESYRLFKRCSTMNGDTEGFSCSAAIKSYMSCAFDEC
mmetsp:Transcript_29833/g.54152  ORF Transcript_29833/g.54152 Transcript_29833/m.54152 type:complete len:83 (+) Transcript_29833:148-396(+)